MVFSLTDSPSDRLVVENYLDSSYRIENIEIQEQTFLLEEIVEPVQVIGEFSQVSNFDHNQQTIQLDNSYENPIVFALPLSLNENDPAIVRITDVQSDSFTAYLQEAEYTDGNHADESFSYLVVEAGTWEMQDGTLLEVGTVDTDLVTTQGWVDINFEADFVEKPAILSQVQTNNESEFVRTRQDRPSIDGFSLSMEEEEAFKNLSHATETLGWLAIEPGQGNWGGLEYQAGNTDRKVGHQGYNLNFSQDFDSEPSLFASLASFYGVDSAGLRYENLSNTQVDIIVEEDRSLDEEINHVTEIVDFLAISGSSDLIATTYEPVVDTI